jgi:pyridoxamine 5'-phosphate oxidase-like protein
MSWRVFEQGAPELARRALEEFDRAAMALVGTIRADGSPRISSVQPCALDGELYLGMMWRSRKADDLQRDPRVVLRNAVCTNTGTEAELTVRGRVVEIDDPATRHRFVVAVSATTTWHEPEFHLFALEVESASLVEYGEGTQTVRLWPEGTTTQREY